MNVTRFLAAALSFCLTVAPALTARADDDDMQAPAALALPPIATLVRYDRPQIAITHVRVVDGTGAAAREDQTVLLERGKITAFGSSASVPTPAGATVIDAGGETIMPGLVGTHDHLYYVSGGPLFIMREMPYSFPRLYLAAGVTTLRTTGSVETYTDLRIKDAIDRGRLAGPNLDVTGPYMTGMEPYFLQMGDLHDAADARRTVDFWADRGVTSFKIYMNVAPEIAAAVISAAHARHLRVAGHLCSIGFREAAAMGFDSLEHGILVDTDFYPGKSAHICPNDITPFRENLKTVDIDGPQVKATIADLIAHHVAISSTLPNFEVANRQVEARILDVLDAQSKIDLGKVLDRAESTDPAIHARVETSRTLVAKEIAFERAFYAAGGLLTNGPDPTGAGVTIAGFGDQRGVEMLVQGGFTPLQAIHIATENGARSLGRESRIGTIAVGKDADVVLVRGNPLADITSIEKVDVVFKGGVGYDSAKLIDSVRGIVGRQ